MTSVLPSGTFFGTRIGQELLGPFRFTETVYPAGTRLPWHQHEKNYLTLVVSGGYHERLQDTSRECPPRSIVAHPAGESHSDTFRDRSARCVNLEMDHGVSARLRQFDASFDEPAMLAGSLAVFIQRRFLAELKSSDDLSPMIIEGLLLEMYGQMARRRKLAGKHSPRFVDQARLLIEQRFLEPISLHDVALEIDMHPSHLARAFRTSFGMTVGEMVRRLRINEAVRLIEAGTALSIVAGETGFSDQSHFTRTFARMTGTTPGRFRRLHRRR